MNYTFFCGSFSGVKDFEEESTQCFDKYVFPPLTQVSKADIHKMFIEIVGNTRCFEII